MQIELFDFQEEARPLLKTTCDALNKRSQKPG